jgi:hypothetical protein
MLSLTSINTYRDSLARSAQTIPQRPAKGGTQLVSFHRSPNRPARRPCLVRAQIFQPPIRHNLSQCGFEMGITESRD